MPKMSMFDGKFYEGQCIYRPKFGNSCRESGIANQGGLCFWHSNLLKTREQVVTEIQRGRSMEGVVLRNLDITGADLRGARFRGFIAYHCAFDKCDFRTTEHGGATSMQMAVFEGCNFVDANLRNVYAEAARFNNCVFYGANLSKANLLAAHLIDSSFQKVNFQGSHFGQPAVPIYPGVGNLDKYYTRIDGSNFNGADFSNVILDERYRNATNLQEPLRRVWLNTVREQLAYALERPMSNSNKKRTLEDLSATILDGISGLKIQSRDKRRKSSEIDLIVINRSNELATAGLGGPIFVECRNVKNPVEAKGVRDFFGKLPANSIGIMITTNRLTKDAKDEIRTKNNENGIRLLFWELVNLETISKGQESPETQLIESYYHVLSL